MANPQHLTIPHARLVGDTAHLWVETDAGEAFSLGRSKTTAYTGAGRHVDWKLMVRTLPADIGLGVAVFPLARELILVLATWLLLLRKGVEWKDALFLLAVLLVGVLLIRDGGWGSNSSMVKVWIGILTCLSAIFLLYFIGHMAQLETAAKAKA